MDSLVVSHCGQSVKIRDISLVWQSNWWESHGLGVCEKLFTEEKKVSCLGISANGRVLASGNAFCSTVYFWDIRTCKMIRKVKMKPNHAKNYIFLDDDKKIVLGTDAHEEMAVWVFDIQGGKVYKKLEGMNGAPIYLWQTLDGKIIAAGWDNVLSCWDVEKENIWRIGKESPNVADRIESVVATKDWKIVTGDYWGNMIVCDFIKKKLTCRLKAHRNSISALGVDSKGRIISGEHGDVIRIWDSEASKQIGEISLAKDSFVTLLIVTPDDKIIIVNQRENCVIEIRDFNGYKLREIPIGIWVRSMVLTTDGNIIIGGDDPFIRVFRITDRELFLETEKTENKILTDQNTLSLS